MDFDNEDMVPTDDTSELEDKAEDWEYDNPFSWWCVRELCDNGWFDGVEVYYNKLLAESIIHLLGWETLWKIKTLMAKNFFSVEFETYIQKSLVETLSHFLFLRDNAVLCYLRAVINLSTTNTAN